MELHEEEPLEPLVGSGCEWELSASQLKRRLYDANGDVSAAGLCHLELARRAVAEYERFAPRVLSWHDYQHITFWFFGGMGPRPRGGGGFFGSSEGRKLFVEERFFREAAKVMAPRLQRMHPISLTYFLWTFTRAGVVDTELMEAVGDQCTELLPTMDRCSLGTMVWNFWKQSVRHDRLFEDAAAELSRPNRVRSLAPRNIQNVMIAFSRAQHRNRRLTDALALSMPRLLGHDPASPKLGNHLVFPYTCKDGSEVLPDAFRIGNLTTILRAFNDLEQRACSPEMLRYVQRSVERSPPSMRMAGDAAAFLAQLFRQPGHDEVRGLLETVDVPLLLKGAPHRLQEQVLALLGTRRGASLSRKG